MKCNKFILFFLAIFFYCPRAAAQDSEYVYRDSSAMAAEQSAAATDAQKSKPLIDDRAEDSVLYRNQLAMAADSAEALKKLRPFGYAANLDSLLMALKKQQRTTPVVHAQSSWLESFFSSPIVKAFFWILACLFILFILSKLFFARGLFQRATLADRVMAIAEKPEENFAAADYTKLISESIAGGDFRVAVRYLYLQTLQKLAARNVISFAPAKTNNEYIREVAGKPYTEEFAKVTLQYEYIWYGGFQPDETMFGKIQHNFKQFNSKL